MAETLALLDEIAEESLSLRKVSLDSGISSMSTGTQGGATPSTLVNTETPETTSSSQTRRKKRRQKPRFTATTFDEAYTLKGEFLGAGSFGNVETCILKLTGHEYAVKIIEKSNYYFCRSKIMKEIELYYWCRGQTEIIQLIDYFEDDEKFYLIFEKALGGPLLSQIEKRVRFTESEASAIIKELAQALKFLHEKGIAHRDLKPENILCLNADSPTPIRLCDFDLCSSVNQTISTPRLMSPVGSAEYMAPEVVEIFDFDDDFYFNGDSGADSMTEADMALSYDKRCDLWSLGVIAYILLCGYPPFQGKCGKDCGWNDRGASCTVCQQRLFSAIKGGKLEFPEQDWSSISSDAKDLISKLLVKEASQRLDAGSILKHPWIVSGGASNQVLETPRVLRKQQSVMDFSEFASNALAIKRNFESPYSFTRALMRALPSDEETAAVKKSIMSISNLNVSSKNPPRRFKKPTSAIFTNTRA